MAHRLNRVATKRLCTPGMGMNLWGASPLSEDIKSIMLTIVTTSRRQGQYREVLSEGRLCRSSFRYYRPIPEFDEWLRRRLRTCYWKQWRWLRTKIRHLLALGIKLKDAIIAGVRSKGPYCMSRTKVTAGHCSCITNISTIPGGHKWR
jgi:hypothetical protein